MKTRWRLRFGLRGMMAGTALVAIGLSWWITWPQRSAERFVDLMESDPQRASKIGGEPQMWRLLSAYQHERPTLSPNPRSLANMLCGVQSFHVIVRFADTKLEDANMEIGCGLVFERGRLHGPMPNLVRRASSNAHPSLTIRNYRSQHGEFSSIRWIVSRAVIVTRHSLVNILRRLYRDLSSSVHLGLWESGLAERT